MIKKFIFLVLFLFSFPAVAVEEILLFDSVITVQPDASIVVRETISVNREGDKIRRGIYRDLPKTKGVKYELISVGRDGEQEPSFTESKGFKFRINTGNDDYLPGNGIYTYEIVYRAFNAVRSEEGFDEIYWNVTGNDWDFPIRRVFARVVLPEGAKQVQQAGYVGHKGSAERAIYQQQDGSFDSGRSLDREEGMTIAVGFEKGFVTFSKTAQLFSADSFEAILLLAVMIMAAYMYITWSIHGKDPVKEDSVPRSDPPKNLTAAQAAYVYTYGAETDKCLVLAFLQMAINKFLKIEEKTNFRISTLRPAETNEEKLFEKNLFFPLTIASRYNPELPEFSKTFVKYLKSTTGEQYFVSNMKYTVFGVILAVAMTAGLCYMAGALIFLLPLLFYTPFFMAIGAMVMASLRSKATGCVAVVFSLFILGHFSAMTFGFMQSAENTNAVIGVAVFHLLMLCALPVYYRLMYRPTELGQKVIAHIDGIKAFLQATRSDFAREASFEKMEKLLPYAVLLGLEKEWDDKAKEMIQAMQEPPLWYVGHPFRASRFSRFRSTVASAGTPPSRSRSGSGGGGSSGGGRGGGGGGGR